MTMNTLRKLPRQWQRPGVSDWGITNPGPGHSGASREWERLVGRPPVRYSEAAATSPSWLA